MATTRKKQKLQAMPFFIGLPVELVISILSFLDIPSLCKLFATNSLLQKAQYLLADILRQHGCYPLPPLQATLSIPINYLSGTFGLFLNAVLASTIVSLYPGKHARLGNNKNPTYIECRYNFNTADMNRLMYLFCILSKLYGEKYLNLLIYI